MIADTLSNLNRTAVQQLVQIKSRDKNLYEYEDNPGQLRRLLAAETANREFERLKDRALIESHRLGFMR